MVSVNVSTCRAIGIPTKQRNSRPCTSVLRLIDIPSLVVNKSTSLRGRVLYSRAMFWKRISIMLSTIEFHAVGPKSVAFGEFFASPHLKLRMMAWTILPVFKWTAKIELRGKCSWKQLKKGWFKITTLLVIIFDSPVQWSSWGCFPLFKLSRGNEATSRVKKESGCLNSRLN